MAKSKRVKKVQKSANNAIKKINQQLEDLAVDDKKLEKEELPVINKKEIERKVKETSVKKNTNAKKSNTKSSTGKSSTKKNSTNKSSDKKSSRSSDLIDNSVKKKKKKRKNAVKKKTSPVIEDEIVEVIKSESTIKIEKLEEELRSLYDRVEDVVSDFNDEAIPKVDADEIKILDNKKDEEIEDYYPKTILDKISFKVLNGITLFLLIVFTIMCILFVVFIVYICTA